MSLNDFEIAKMLGEGAYSSVYYAKRLSDSEYYALKKVKMQNLSDKEKENAINEVRILASINHPNIVAYKEAFIDEASSSLWYNFISDRFSIVMEYADDGDLFQKICSNQKANTLIKEDEIWRMFIQIVRGLKCLHEIMILHRDLKSANVFLNKDGTAKLGDMNVSKVAKKGLLYTQTGTPYYASPEVWKDQPYDSKSDIWSLGCVLYEAVTMKPPFRAEDMQGLYKKVLRGIYPKIPASYSNELATLIKSLIQVSPGVRPSCDKILEMPSIKKKISKLFPQEDTFYQSNSQLLSTIRVPLNLLYLTDRLPKPNYSPTKQMIEEEEKLRRKTHDVGGMLPEIKSSQPKTIPKHSGSQPASVKNQSTKILAQSTLHNVLQTPQLVQRSRVENSPGDPLPSEELSMSRVADEERKSVASKRSVPIIKKQHSDTNMESKIIEEQTSSKAVSKKDTRRVTEYENEDFENDDVVKTVPIKLQDDQISQSPDVKRAHNQHKKSNGSKMSASELGLQNVRGSLPTTSQSVSQNPDRLEPLKVSRVINPVYKHADVFNSQNQLKQITSKNKIGLLKVSNDAARPEITKVEKELIS